MPVRFLSDAELARLSSWPDEIAEHDLVTFFTPTSDDAGWLSRQYPGGEPARCRGLALYAAGAWLDTRRPDRLTVRRGEPSRLPVGPRARRLARSAGVVRRLGGPHPTRSSRTGAHHGSDGERAVAASASSATRSCWRGRWNTRTFPTSFVTLRSTTYVNSRRQH
jgi:hypothetical protein